jgi:hypothetical protein
MPRAIWPRTWSRRARRPLHDPAQLRDRRAKPLSVYVDLHGTGKDVEEARLEKVLREVMDLSPRGIREHLHLNRPIYAPTSAYGHFGRTPDEGSCVPLSGGKERRPRGSAPLDTR